MSKSSTKEISNPQKSKRKFLKILGGGVIVAAAGGAAFLATRTPDKAIKPWKLALGPNAKIDPRHIVLSHAILAPNPHNRQPWVADLSVENEIVLYCDLERRLPHTDPFDRQITIGLGCFLELLDMAAKQAGYRADIALFPQGEPSGRLDERPVARIKLIKDDGVTGDPLFGQIFERRSNKDPYDTSREVSKETIEQILSAVNHGSNVSSEFEMQRIMQLRKLTFEALMTEMSTPQTAKESIDLMRIGKAEINENPDGISMGGAFYDSLYALGLLSREQMLTMDEASLKQMEQVMKPPLDTAMGYLQVTTFGNGRKDQINAGRDYVRLNLKATQMGIAMQPLSQSLQEFEEMKPHREAINAFLSIQDTETLQMFARIGYGEKPAPSPRWPYETRIRNE